MVFMRESAWGAMALPPTILRSASMATWPDSCRRVLSPSSTRATWEYPPAGAGTVAGLSKMTMMSASFRVKSSPSWTGPGRPRYARRDCTWTIRGGRRRRRQAADRRIAAGQLHRARAVSLPSSEALSCPYIRQCTVEMAMSQVPWNAPPPAVRIKELDFAERPVAFLAHGRAPRASRITSSGLPAGVLSEVQSRCGYRPTGLEGIVGLARPSGSPRRGRRGSGDGRPPDAAVPGGQPPGAHQPWDCGLAPQDGHKTRP